jgi:hypothetical protein
MNGIYGINEAEGYEDAYEEASDEAYEEARRPTPRPVGTAGRGSAYQPRPNTATVTQAQLQTALARVSQQINVNSTAIKTVDGRTRAVAAEQTRLGSGLKKEFADRKRDILAVRKDLQATREASVLLPLLGSLGGAGSAIGALAPLLLLGNDVSADPNAPGAAAANSGGLLGGLGGGGTGLIALLALSGALAPRTPTP